MALSLASRFKNAVNAFLNTREWNYYGGQGTTYGFRSPSFGYGDRTIATVLYNRLAADAASLTIQHVRLDAEGRYKDVIKDGLNNCLTLDANLDQTGKAFMLDAVFTMLSEGVVALAPIDTDKDPELGSFDVLSLRVGTVVEWYPHHVKLSVYNENTGMRDELIMNKKYVPIIQNPFYSIMNEPNSTLKRLLRKLSLLDVMDERIGNGKLDLIIQLPYIVRGETKHKQADARKKEIEDQLINSPYGIAYIDGTEHITQLNRPVENAFVSQVEYLTNSFYSQSGVSKAILDGTASEDEMENYYARVIEPIVSAFVEEMSRKFLTPTARSQGQSIMYFRDPFKLVPVGTVADMADKFIRSQILTPNEFRQIVGRKPSSDPRADELRNPNLNQSNQEIQPTVKQDQDNEEEQTIERRNQNGL